jgi:hypothetical protein
MRRAARDLTVVSGAFRCIPEYAAVIPELAVSADKLTSPDLRILRVWHDTRIAGTGARFARHAHWDPRFVPG